MTGLLLSVVINSIRSKVDGSISIAVETQELTPSKAGEIFGLRGKIAAMYLTPKDTIPAKDIEQIDAIEVEFGEKTPSKRLRDVLYIAWTQGNEGFKEFDSFYKFKMNLIIEHYKSKLQ